MPFPSARLLGGLQGGPTEPADGLQKADARCFTGTLASRKVPVAPLLYPPLSPWDPLGSALQQTAKGAINVLTAGFWGSACLVYWKPNLEAFSLTNPSHSLPPPSAEGFPYVRTKIWRREDWRSWLWMHGEFLSPGLSAVTCTHYYFDVGYFSKSNCCFQSWLKVLPWDEFVPIYLLHNQPLKKMQKVECEAGLCLLHAWDIPFILVTEQMCLVIWCMK